jgi:hypothetical protein
MSYLLVCGSRNWTDLETIQTDIKRHRQAGDTLLHGNANGADRLADLAAARLCMPVEAIEANWAKHRDSAGILRNIAMLNKKPRIVLAYWDGKSKGTRHTITEAIKRGIPTFVCYKGESKAERCEGLTPPP